jgi:hypothetical protein
MSFAQWLLLSENINNNFNDWVASIVRHANIKDLNSMNYAGFFGTGVSADIERASRWGSKEYTKLLEDQILKSFDNNLSRYKKIIIKVLSNKNLENINWLSFSLGYLIVKVFHEEDLDLAIEVTKNRISSGELPKSQIGQEGWFRIGLGADKFVKEYLLQQQELSNRKKRKLQKEGDTLEKDKDLIRFIAKEGEYQLIFLPQLGIHPDFIEEKKDKVESRKRLLCKYGKTTSWCTANPTGSYDHYYLNNDIYILEEGGKPKYQFVSCESAGRAGSSSAQFMDVDDEVVKEIKYKEKSFLNKHVKKEISCYNFDLFFESIEEYKNSDNNDKNKISSNSCLSLIQDENFKNLEEYEKRKLIKKSGSYIWDKEISEKFSEKEYELVSNDQLIIGTRISLYSPWIHEILKKVSKKRFEDLVNDHLNSNVTKQELTSAGNLTKTQIRKINLRKILNSQIRPGTHGDSAFSTQTLKTPNIFKIVELLTSKIEIGPLEAYTIFDFIINQIHSSNPLNNFENNELSGLAKKNLAGLANAMGKDAINKIDLDRMQERLSIKFIKVGNKYKIENQPYKFINKLIVYFLKKYSDKILSDE